MTFPEWQLFLLSMQHLAQSVSSWFSDLMFSSNQVFFFYLSAFAIYQLTRLLLSPILGGSMRGGASDQVKSKKVKDKT